MARPDGIMWNNIIAGFILASITGGGLMNWYSQEKLNDRLIRGDKERTEIHKAIYGSVAVLDKGLASTNIHVNHNDLTCTARYNELVAEDARIKTMLTTHISERPDH